MLRGHFSKLRPLQLNTLPFVMFAVENLLYTSLCCFCGHLTKSHPFRHSSVNPHRSVVGGDLVNPYTVVLASKRRSGGQGFSY